MLWGCGAGLWLSLWHVSQCHPPLDTAWCFCYGQVQSKIEGRGNGIKTVIPNMVEVAQALNRNPAYPTKYFGCELGAQSRYNAEVRTPRAHADVPAVWLSPCAMWCGVAAGWCRAVACGCGHV